MDHPNHGGSTLRAIPILAVIALLTSLAIIPAFFSSKAQKQKGKGLLERTQSHSNEIPNYDIRSDKSAFEKLGEIRGRLGHTAASVADRKDKVARAEAQLRSSAADVKVTYGSQSRMP